MTVYALLPDAKIPFHTSAGNLANGYKLFVYETGTANKATTFTDSTGTSSNTNPIVLNSRGETPYGVYVNSGAYKLVLCPDTDTDPPSSPIWSTDGITPTNDISVAAATEWTDSGLTPTYVSGTSFTVPGNQTVNFHIGRRLKTTNSGGSVYSTISNSVYGAVTTITVVNDSSTLDSGLSDVYYGFLSANNPSVPTITGLPAGSVLDNAADSVAMLDASAGQMVEVPLGTFKSTTYLVTNFSANTGTTTVPFLPSGLSTIGYSEIVVMFEGVSISGTDDILLQLIDSGGAITSGYFSRAITFTGTTLQTSGSSAGFIIPAGAGTAALSGSVTLVREKTVASPGGDKWHINGGMPNSVGSNGSIITMGNGSLGSATPARTLDGLRLITTGANTFDAGTIWVTGRT